MAVMAGAVYQPISYVGVPRMNRPDIVCAHTIVGNDPAPAAHFSVRSDGYITQSRDTAYQSAANWNGNWHVIAIETDDQGEEFGDWDEGDGHDVPPWTGPQCESLATILVWCHRIHGIPLEMVPDSRPERRGAAYHRQGIKGNWEGYAYGGWIEGGELWSQHTGKVCPGDRRIKQWREVVLPRARVLAGLDPESPKKNEEREMPSGTFEPQCDPDTPGRITIAMPKVGGDTGLRGARLHTSCGWYNELRYKVWFARSGGGYASNTGQKVPEEYVTRSDQPGWIGVPANTAQISIEYTTALDDSRAAWMLELDYA